MRYRCGKCSSPPDFFDFESQDGPDKVRCPQCGTLKHRHNIAVLADVHFFGPHPDGPIMSMDGPRMIACQPERKHMAPNPLRPDIRVQQAFFSATPEPAAVTCPACKKTELFKEQYALFHPEAAAEEAAAAPRPGG